MADDEVWDAYSWTHVKIKEERGRFFFLCEKCGVVVLEERRSLHERRGCPNPTYCQECRVHGRRASHMTKCPVRGT